MSIRMCLIGESNLLRAGLKMLFSNTRFQVEREAQTLDQMNGFDAHDALFLVEHHGDVREIEASISALRKCNPSCRIVVLAKSIEPDQLALSFAAGVDGYVLQEISPEALLESLHLVMLGEKVFPSRLALLMCGENRSTYRQRPACTVPLSDREIEIIQRLADGLPNKVIASQLSISEATVKVHLKTILKKLGVSNRTQAAIWAVQNGLSNSPAMLTFVSSSTPAKLEPAA